MMSVDASDSISVTSVTTDDDTQKIDDVLASLQSEFYSLRSEADDIFSSFGKPPETDDRSLLSENPLSSTTSIYELQRVQFERERLTIENKEMRQTIATLFPITESLRNDKESLTTECHEWRRKFDIMYEELRSERKLREELERENGRLKCELFSLKNIEREVGISTAESKEENMAMIRASLEEQRNEISRLAVIVNQERKVRAMVERDRLENPKTDEITKTTKTVVSTTSEDSKKPPSKQVSRDTKGSYISTKDGVVTVRTGSITTKLTIPSANDYLRRVTEKTLSDNGRLRKTSEDVSDVFNRTRSEETLQTKTKKEFVPIIPMNMVNSPPLLMQTTSKPIDSFSSKTPDAKKVSNNYVTTKDGVVSIRMGSKLTKLTIPSVEAYQRRNTIPPKMPHNDSILRPENVIDVYNRTRSEETLQTKTSKEYLPLIPQKNMVNPQPLSMQTTSKSIDYSSSKKPEMENGNNNSVITKDGVVSIRMGSKLTKLTIPSAEAYQRRNTIPPKMPHNDSILRPQCKGGSSISCSDSLLPQTRFSLPATRRHSITNSTCGLGNPPTLPSKSPPVSLTNPPFSSFPQQQQLYKGKNLNNDTLLQTQPKQPCMPHISLKNMVNYQPSLIQTAPKPIDDSSSNKKPEAKKVSNNSVTTKDGVVSIRMGSTLTKLIIPSAEAYQRRNTIPPKMPNNDSILRPHMRP